MRSRMRLGPMSGGDGRTSECQSGIFLGGIAKSVEERRCFDGYLSEIFQSVCLSVGHGNRGFDMYRKDREVGKAGGLAWRTTKKSDDPIQWVGKECNLAGICSCAAYATVSRSYMNSILFYRVSLPCKSKPYVLYLLVTSLNS